MPDALRPAVAPQWYLRKHTVEIPDAGYWLTADRPNAYFSSRHHRTNPGMRATCERRFLIKRIYLRVKYSIINAAKRCSNEESGPIFGEGTMNRKCATDKKGKARIHLLILCGIVPVVTIVFSGRLYTNRQVTMLTTAIAEANNKSENSEPNKQSKTDKEKMPKKPTHSHPAFEQRKEERARMVRTQIAARDIQDANMLEAMLTVPRHAFVREGDLRRAYNDHPLPIGLGQTISQPYIVAYMTEALKLDPNDKVLEIGTGSGYQAAVCAEIAKEIYTIEILEQLAESAGKRLKELGYENVSVKSGDGYFGWPEEGPFDAIIITAATPMFPPPLIEQLKAGGVMILPLGSPYGPQRLVLVTKERNGQIKSRGLLPVRFVPMVGRVQKTEVKKQEVKKQEQRSKR